MAAKPVGDEPAIDVDKLFADAYAEKALLMSEKPWHRFALQLAVKAKMSPSDIAKVLYCPVQQIRDLFATPHFKKRYDEEMAHSGGSVYDRLLEGEDIHCLLTMIEIRDSDKTPPAVRYKVAADLLDRIKGKATLNIKTSSNDSVDTKTGIDAMEQRLADLDRQQQELLGATAKGKTLPGSYSSREAASSS